MYSIICYTNYILFGSTIQHTCSIFLILMVLGTEAQIIKNALFTSFGMTVFNNSHKKDSPNSIT